MQNGLLCCTAWSGLHCPVGCRLGVCCARHAVQQHALQTCTLFTPPVPLLKTQPSLPSDVATLVACPLPANCLQVMMCSATSRPTIFTAAATIMKVGAVLRAANWSGFAAANWSRFAGVDCCRQVEPTCHHEGRLPSGAVAARWSQCAAARWSQCAAAKWSHPMRVRSQHNQRYRLVHSGAPHRSHPAAGLTAPD